MAARKMAGAPAKLAWTVSPTGRVRSRPLNTGTSDDVLEYNGNKLSDRFHDRGQFAYTVKPEKARLGWCTLEQAYALDSREEMREPADEAFTRSRVGLYIEDGDTARMREEKRARHERRIRELTGQPRGYVEFCAFDWASEHNAIERVPQVVDLAPRNGVVVVDKRPAAERPPVRVAFPTERLPELVLFRRSKSKKLHAVSGDVSAPNFDHAARHDEVLRQQVDPALQALQEEAAQAKGITGDATDGAA